MKMNGKTTQSEAVKVNANNIVEISLLVDQLIG